VVLKLYPKEGGSFVVFFFPNIEAAGNLPVGGGGNDLSAAGQVARIPRLGREGR
jgi:hypothetical protein